MKNILMASEKNIEDVVSMRVEMQIEDWKTIFPDMDFSPYAEEFAGITRNHVLERLNKTIFVAMMYCDDEPVAMCALEELEELPQITVCMAENGRRGALASVYTKVDHRGNGYQQELVSYILEFAKKENFNDITLATNTPAAMHIYEKAGFKRISNKYFLSM